MALTAYVSGHGFGHATRTAEVLRAVRAQARELPIFVASSAPAFLFHDAVSAPLAVRTVECDVGLAQRDALRIDTAATVARWRAFRAGWDALVEREARAVSADGTRLVVGDIPPLATAVARASGLTSIAIGNFSWDWIYAHVARGEPALEEAASFCARAYGETDLLLRLPFAGDLSAFPRIEDLPLVARRPGVARARARGRLGLTDAPAILLSFGGVGMPELDPGVYAGLRGWQLLVTGRVRPRPLPPNVRLLDAAALEAAGLRYPDLVGAVDVVVSKPGYGIVTDCIGAGTRLVYTDRGDFPEYPILVREMARWLPAAFVSNEELVQGRIGDAVESVRGREVPPPPDLGGADRAAARILERLGEVEAAARGEGVD